MKSSFFFFLFWCTSLFPQSLILGKINSEVGELDGVLIVNSVTKKYTVSDHGGSFEIEANLNDKLIFSSDKIQPLEIRLELNSFRQKPLIVKVQIKIKELAEIQVTAISSKGMNGNVKTYTPAERKLRAAGSFKWYSPLLIPFGGMSVDGLINSVSGRTAMLKKEVQVERFEMYNMKLRSLFLPEFYTKTLAIPEEYVEGFIVYASENPKVIQNLKVKNLGDLRFTLAEIAIPYKNMISQQK